MSHNFGCEATDWLRGIFHMESVLSFWMELPLFRYLKVQGLALFSRQYTNDVLKRCVISSFCGTAHVRRTV